MRADVEAGEAVALDLTAEAPPGTGDIVRVEWDYESTGAFAEATDLSDPAAHSEVCETHTYEQPGTYFAVARITSQRDGDPDAAFGLVQNLARVRIVVQ